MRISNIIQVYIFHTHVLKNVVYLCDKPKSTHKYVQSHFIILHHYVLVTSVTIISVSHIKNTNNVQ